MDLHRRLGRRETDGTPLRIGLIGAGKFAAMYLCRIPRTPGVRLVAVADLEPDAARQRMAGIGWDAAQLHASSAEQARNDDMVWFTDDAMRLIAADGIDIVIDATGHAVAGVRHALACCEHGRHIVMVNVEADALAGPWLAREAERAGIVYSLAYGDQPALIAEQVDWARTCGFEVIAAGKGTRFLPEYHTSTPDTIWDHYGLTAEDAREGGMNARMFNSFLDGTKSAIEMAAVANATGLAPPEDGLAFPPCGVDDLAHVLRPREVGGVLDGRGRVEVISSLERDGRPVFRDLRWGVYVVIAGDSAYARRCFREYGLVTDDTGEFTAMYKPFHLIGLELGISVASVGLRGEPTGSPMAWQADVAAVAKHDLEPGDRLDGEGGFDVYGRLVSAGRALEGRTLPIGLADGVRVTRAVAAGSTLTLDDVELDAGSDAMRAREGLRDCR